MGRKKIEIKLIEDEKNRKSTFDKRKEGLMKKAYELSELTGATIGLIVISELGSMEMYTQKDVFKKYTEEEIPDENVIIGGNQIKKIYGKKWKLDTTTNNNTNSCKSDVNKQNKKRKLNELNYNNEDFQDAEIFYTF